MGDQEGTAMKMVEPLDLCMKDCFICLKSIQEEEPSTSTTADRGASSFCRSLQLLCRYLEVNWETVVAAVTVDEAWARLLISKVDLTKPIVTVCAECVDMMDKIDNRIDQVLAVEEERGSVVSCFRELHERIITALTDTELVDSYHNKMAINIQTFVKAGVYDKLRKEIAEKCNTVSIKEVLAIASESSNDNAAASTSLTPETSLSNLVGSVLWTDCHCFFCLKVEDGSNEQIANYWPIQKLLQFLQVNIIEICYKRDPEGNSDAAAPDVIVTLCNACENVKERIILLPQELNQNRKELDELLNQISEKMSDANQSVTQIQKSNTNGIRSSWEISTEIVNHLRREISEKCTTTSVLCRIRAYSEITFLSCDAEMHDDAEDESRARSPSPPKLLPELPVPSPRVSSAAAAAGSYHTTGQPLIESPVAVASSPRGRGRTPKPKSTIKFTIRRTSEPEEKKYQCNNCGNDFDSSSKLRQHLISEHKYKRCGVCLEVYKRLDRHQDPRWKSECQKKPKKDFGGATASPGTTETAPGPSSQQQQESEGVAAQP